MVEHPAVIDFGQVVSDDEPVPTMRVHVTDEPVKCDGCGRTIAWKATRPYRIQCRHCHVDVER